MEERENNKLNLLLKSRGFRFKKQYGQNFIADTNLLASIVDGSGADRNSTVVEIGCGAGTLTRVIAAHVEKVISFEIDRELKSILDVTLAGIENAKIIFSDFMKTDMQSFEAEIKPYIVIANLPYYITTPLVMKFIEKSSKCLSLTIMVQEEVAERFCAEPGTAEYGAITASIALRGTCRIIKRVSRRMFSPMPNVDSAVVRIDIKESNVCVKDERVYRQVVRAAFSSRRKTLENNLMHCFKLPRDVVRMVLESCSFDSMTRGEQISPVQFAAIADALISKNIVKTRL